MRERRPAIPWFTTDELEWLEHGNVGERFQKLLDANRQIRREVFAAPGVYRRLRELGYDGGVGDVRFLESPRAPRDLFSNRIESIPSGTPYVLGIRDPIVNTPSTSMTLRSAWSSLTGGSTQLPELRQYVVVAGYSGVHHCSCGRATRRIVFTRRLRPSTSTSGWNPGCRRTPFDGQDLGMSSRTGNTSSRWSAASVSWP